MWILKCIVTLVIIGANGIVTKVLKKNLEAIPGEYSTDHYKRQLRVCKKHHT
jgi:hypothetical protein